MVDGSKITNKNRWLIKFQKFYWKDQWFNFNNWVKHQFFYNIFDRARFVAGVIPDGGARYFLRIQIMKQTIVAKSRKLKAKWTIEES